MAAAGLPVVGLAEERWVQCHSGGQCQRFSQMRTLMGRGRCACCLAAGLAGLGLGQHVCGVSGFGFGVSGVVLSVFGA